MMRALSLTLCLVLPTAAFAGEPAPLTPPPDAPAAVAPVASPPLVPAQVQAPTGATEGTRACAMGYGGCGGRGKGKGKWIVLTGVVGTLVTAAAVGLAVGVAASSRPAPQLP